MESISPHDWLSLVHPVMMILFVYPVFGATVRLGTLAREKRLDLNPIADTVPIEHAQHAAWAVGGILVAIPIALSVSLLKTTSPFTLLLVAGAVLFSYSKVLKTKLIWQRLAWAATSWIGLLLLGLQPAVERLSDQPWSALFWQSHFWMGMALIALLLATTAMQPSIGRNMQIRRLHISINVIVALLLFMQAVSGARNLLLR
jgi:hypothetical protein